ncbi:hypothetical protein FDZ84_18830 [Saccharopolyspora sp. ASAGF58]|nr:hypothetical protein FDZ84_18830 [Saccharopolyspora sp. ASAGF58]
MDRRFTFHTPTSDKATEHQHVRGLFRGLVEELNERLPEGREKSLAITKLEEGLMRSNAAIARPQTEEA